MSIFSKKEDTKTVTADNICYRDIISGKEINIARKLFNANLAVLKANGVLIDNRDILELREQCSKLVYNKTNTNF